MNNTTEKKIKIRLKLTQQGNICNKRNLDPSLNQTKLGEWARQEFGTREPVCRKIVSNILRRSPKIYRAIRETSSNGVDGKSRYILVLLI